MTDELESIAARTRRALQARTAAETDGAPDDLTDDADVSEPEHTTGHADVLDSADSTALEPDDDVDGSEPDATETDTAETGAAETDAAQPDAAAPVDGRRAGMWLVVPAAILLVASLVFAVVATVVWARSRNSADPVVAAREAALLAARQDVATLNTADYRHAKESVAAWRAVATGKLAGDLGNEGTQAVTAIAQAKFVTSATVRAAAVTALDTTKGTATVIVSLTVRKQPAGGNAQSTRNRFRASLTRTGGDWKLADLGSVSVQLG